MFQFLKEIGLSMGMDEVTATYYAKRLVRFLNNTNHDLQTLPSYTEDRFALEFKAATGKAPEPHDFEILSTALAA